MFLPAHRNRCKSEGDDDRRRKSPAALIAPLTKAEEIYARETFGLRSGSDVAMVEERFSQPTTTSVAVARKRNRRLIASGPVEVIHASVSSMPFPDATFDCALAAESYYFWPDIAGDLAEVRLVMKPSGQLVIMAGMYRGSRFNRRNEGLIRAGGMRCFSAEELEETLQAAGFPSVAVTVEPRKGWMCVVAGSGFKDSIREYSRRDTA